MDAVETVAPTTTTADARRRQLLETALSVFARHGYRKTSMDDVAHAAGVSRQGLYLHFLTKEDLFRAAVQQALRRSQLSVAAALAIPDAPLEVRLERAFDEWVGQFVEAIGSNVDELVSVCHALLGPAVEQEKAVFCERISAALTDDGLARAYESVGVSADELAATLCATAEGLKHKHDTRASFVAAMRVAIMVVCRPLRFAG